MFERQSYQAGHDFRFFVDIFDELRSLCRIARRNQANEIVAFEHGKVFVGAAVLLRD